MDTSRFRECLDLVGWSQRQLAGLLSMDERQVRRWAGGAPIPPTVAEWLDKLGAFHAVNPPPERRTSKPETA